HEDIARRLLQRTIPCGRPEIRPASSERTHLLDMWVIFVNISRVMDPMIHEERKAPACRQVAPSRGRVPVLRRLVANIAKQHVGNVPSMPLVADKAASRWRLAHRVSAVADRRYPGQSGEM